MTQKLTPTGLQFIYTLIWQVSHCFFQITFHIFQEFRWNWERIYKTVVSCVPAYSTNGQLVRLYKTVETLKECNRKTPKHISVIVFNKETLTLLQLMWRNVQKLFRPNDKDNLNRIALSGGESRSSSIDIQSLAKFLCWAWIADIHVISLYDYNGVLKSKRQDLIRYVYQEIGQILWVVKRVNIPPVIKFQNVLKTNGYSYMNGSADQKSQSEVINICLISNHDGKEAIVKATKGIFREVSELASSGSVLEGIDEAFVEARINSVVQLPLQEHFFKTDPDLLVILGNIKSTTGFLPWHIRLTEIHWLPSLDRLDISDFMKSLQKYATCNQRFGT